PRLGAAADKNDEPPNNAFNDPEHLIGHLVSGPSVKVLNQTIVNQFGTIVLDVVRPDILLVPTLKTVTPPPPPPLTTPAVDHFQCYKVRPSKGAPNFTRRPVKVQDQFETTTVTPLNPIRRCAPANKKDEDPSAPDHPFHLLCYKTKSAPFPNMLAYPNSQFGPASPLLIHRR